MKYLICNTKAHKTFYEMEIYKDGLRNINKNNINLIVAPSTIYLPIFKNEDITLCTQDLCINSHLNLTGDTSIEALKSLNVNYAIIGHYERRKYYHENEDIIQKKINIALENNFKVIYCIGETKEELERKVEYQILEKQIAKILNNVPKNKFKDIIIAYEPTYMIGTNIEPNFNKIEDTINFIKNIIENYYHGYIDVVYGGNITIDNINEFKKINNLDGFIIGNSSLNPVNIKKIIDKMIL